MLKCSFLISFYFLHIAAINLSLAISINKGIAQNCNVVISSSPSVLSCKNTLFPEMLVFWPCSRRCKNEQISLAICFWELNISLQDIGGPIFGLFVGSICLRLSFSRCHYDLRDTQKQGRVGPAVREDPGSMQQPRLWSSNKGFQPRHPPAATAIFRTRSQQWRLTQGDSEQTLWILQVPFLNLDVSVDWWKWT